MTKTISREIKNVNIFDVDSEEKVIDLVIEDLDKIRCGSDQDRIDSVKATLEALKSRIRARPSVADQLKIRADALQRFIDNFPSMLGYWSKDLVNVHSNRAYADYFGKSSDEIRGKHIKDLLGEKIYKLNRPYVENVLNGHPQTFERALPTPSGATKLTLANYIPHYLNGNIVGFFVIVTDISEQKALEQRAKDLESALYEQSKLSSLGQMASGIAHEINNPVAVIYTNSCLILKELKKPKSRKDLVRGRVAEIESMSVRIEQIIDGLRSLTGGAGYRELGVTNVGEAVERTLYLCQARFTKNRIAIDWNPPAKPIFAQCNEVQLSEILLNILNNAFDALEGMEKACVTIALKSTGSQVEVNVSNNGPSIPQEIREKLFLPFFTTKGKRGTGLGLKISRDLAAANNGTLKLADGSLVCFVLTINLVEADR